MKSEKMHESSAPRDGATKSSMGEATMADLKEGYFAVKQPASHFDTFPAALPSGGFAGRPRGWER